MQDSSQEREGRAGDRERGQKGLSEEGEKAL